MYIPKGHVQYYIYKMYRLQSDNVFGIHDKSLNGTKYIEKTITRQLADIRLINIIINNYY